MRLGVCLGNNAQPPKPPDLKGASTWYHKHDPFGPSGDRGGLLSSCSPEAITWHHSNGDSGAVGFFTLLLQVPCPRAGQTASYPPTAPLTSSPDLVLPFTSLNPSFYHSCMSLCPPQSPHKSTTSNCFFQPDTKFDISDSVTCLM